LKTELCLNVFHGSCCGLICLTLSNRSSAGLRNLSRKSLDMYCLVPRDWGRRTASKQPGWRVICQVQGAQPALISRQVQGAQSQPTSKNCPVSSVLRPPNSQGRGKIASKWGS
jgi:hypothetical protein